jgi:hypothetical protein
MSEANALDPDIWRRDNNSGVAAACVDNEAACPFTVMLFCNRNVNTNVVRRIRGLATDSDVLRTGDT